VTPPEITFRKVCDADRPVLFALYASTREAELAQVPWNAEQKHAFLEMQFAGQIRGYAETFPEATHEIILLEDRPVGRLYLSREARRLHILDITIAPESRDAGLGSRVLKGILKEAGASGKPVSIYVESFNPSIRLFERLGFRAASQDGFQLLLEHPPTGSGALESSPAESDL
jgi:ribosomal protein S18 acetylase RimI-like enzyme